MAEPGSYIFVAQICSMTKVKACRPGHCTSTFLAYTRYDIQDEVALNGTISVHWLKVEKSLYFMLVSIPQAEDLAIWEQYGSDGVAVTSRYGLLKGCLDSMPDDTHAGLIQYRASSHQPFQHNGVHND